MHPARLFAVGAGVALVGVVLLVVEVARTLGSNTLGSSGVILLWVGLGLFVAGGVLLLLAAMRSAAHPDELGAANRTD